MNDSPIKNCDLPVCKLLKWPVYNPGYKWINPLLIPLTKPGLFHLRLGSVASSPRKKPHGRWQANAVAAKLHDINLDDATQHLGRRVQSFNAPLFFFRGESMVCSKQWGLISDCLWLFIVDRLNIFIYSWFMVDFVFSMILIARVVSHRWWEIMGNLAAKMGLSWAMLCVLMTKHMQTWSLWSTIVGFLR